MAKKKIKLKTMLGLSASTKVEVHLEDYTYYVDYLMKKEEFFCDVFCRAKTTTVIPDEVRNMEVTLVTTNRYDGALVIYLF